MKQKTICIVGLGYVGLPLAHAFARAGYRVLGFDIDAKRIEELQQGKDRTRELSAEELQKVTITYGSDPKVLADADVIILAIPTPVEGTDPDLTPLLKATETVGKNLRKGSIVVYESTVYPGVTEELCGPLLEKHSGLQRGKDFTIGYSPERVNPGDREHTIDRIVKVVAAEDEQTLATLAELYGSIVKAGIHRAPSIKVAEMAKAIENAQRDLNIAYINEIAMMCGKLGIATRDVLEAAKTKWNFLPFTPGLVGGHCIGVDPYYLIAKAKELRMDTSMMSAARMRNDSMAKYIAEEILSTLKTQKKTPKDSHILVLGLTFKENIPDTRNSKAEDVVQYFKKAGCVVQAHDPFHNHFVLEKSDSAFDAILLLVPHEEYKTMSPSSFAKLGKPGCVFFDLKSIFQRSDFEKFGMTYLAL